MTAPSLTMVWDDRFLEYDFGPSHPFRMATRGLAAALTEEAGRAPSGEETIHFERHVEPSSTEELRRFHSTQYLELVDRASGTELAPPLDGGDTPSFPGCFPASARVVGGTVRALEAILSGSSSRAANPAGGLHHAHPGRASGFCVFNDLAVALHCALESGQGLRRIAYIDIDAHHGDGVMYGFFGDGRVLDIDFHQDGRTLFPGTGSAGEVGTGDGAGLKVNLPLPPLAGDAAVVGLFDRVVPTMLRSYRPELIVLQHGMDAAVGDALAQLQYTPKAYDRIIRGVSALADELCGGRLLVTGGGGYNAESVSLGLARSLLFLGGAESLAQRPIPPRWRDQFTAATGEVAPTEWAPPSSLQPSNWSMGREDRLISELSEAIGTRLPSRG